MSGWRQSLERLPREARDTFFLLATMAATVLPHAAHLPLWCTLLTLGVLGWRGWLAWRDAPLPGRTVLVLLLALTLAGGWATHRSLLGREAGITLLVVLMALKTLELHARRDAFVVFFLGFFLVLTQYFFSQSLLTALWSLACVWGLLSALVLAQMPSGQPQLKLAAMQALRTTALGLPLMLLLFLLFPRIGPLWSLPSDALGRTGLSEQLEFGAMNEIANDDSIAMRLRFDGPRPLPNQLYFRGPVLSRFDGKTWHPAEQADSAAATPAEARRLSPSPQGPELRYELSIEALKLRLLPTLEFDIDAPGAGLNVGEQQLHRGRELQWWSDRPIAERLKLRRSAWPEARHGVEASTSDLQPYLQLPGGFNPRLIAWARELKRRVGPDPLRLHQALIAHLRGGDFLYTLAPGRYEGSDALDEFWFERRLGFCEHYASAYVLAMRAMGVPTRLVTGFQGADLDLQDGDVVVRQSQAHAWAEFWVAGAGWQRADPTAAVAPSRVQRGQALQRPPGLLAGALGQVDPQLWSRLRGAWETLDKRWNDWVLNYSRAEQFGLLERLGWQQPDWEALGQLSAAIIAALGLGASAWSTWSARPHNRWSRQRGFILARLKRLGLSAAPHQAPLHWAASLRETHGEAARELEALLLQLEAQRYGPAGDVAALPWGWRWRQAWRRAERAFKRSIANRVRR